jgi:hypothetical protein
VQGSRTRGSPRKLTNELRQAPPDQQRGCVREAACTQDSWTIVLKSTRRVNTIKSLRSPNKHTRAQTRRSTTTAITSCSGRSAARRTTQNGHCDIKAQKPSNTARHPALHLDRLHCALEPALCQQQASAVDHTVACIFGQYLAACL